jgi:DNA end-binding protein Ku
VKMAKLLIDQMSEEWDPTEHPNEYRRALEKLLASKRTFGLKAAEAKSGARGAKVVDLMEALRKSIAGPGGRAKARKSGSRRSGAA